jgi:hypothetical protein
MKERTHPPVRLTIFSIDEANRVATEIRPELERAARMKREHDQIESRVGVLKIVTVDATGDNPDARELTALANRLEQLRFQIAGAIEAIHRRGCLLKDIERGLVDFYALSGDRLVFLCWQMNEPEVAHWHTLEGGFSARRSLPASDSD